MKIGFEKYVLPFKRPSGTSRGILTEKIGYLLRLEGDNRTGIGECSIIPGLSPEFTTIDQYEAILSMYCDAYNMGTLTPENWEMELQHVPSILFGFETAYLAWKHGKASCFFDNSFYRGKQKIAINGLVWMGDAGFMKQQIDEKIASGFSTVKMKIGAIDFNTEFNLLQEIRSHYSADQITLRVDANGAFTPIEARSILNKLASLDIHSIEQPIKAGNWEAMKQLCIETPIPIALDEELIGVNTPKEQELLLATINPQFIILKPSLHGGIAGTKRWISLAEQHGIPWWMTSALESNIGLEAICQLAAEYANPLPQGLGTGSLYTSNFPSPLTVEKGQIFRKYT